MSLRAILMALILLAGGHAAIAQQVSGITVLSYGIYRADLKMEKRDDGAALPYAASRNICHVMTTQIIPANDKQLFGIAYRVDGDPKGDVVAIRRVVRFPDQNKPGDGPDGYTTFERSDRDRIGSLAYAGWGINEQSKPGVWRAEFFHGERKLLEVGFTVTKDKSFKVVPDERSECFLVSESEPRTNTRVAGR